jgi:hypothetical protein
MLIPVPHIIYKHHHEFLLALLVLWLKIEIFWGSGLESMWMLWHITKSGHFHPFPFTLWFCSEMLSMFYSSQKLCTGAMHVAILINSYIISCCWIWNLKCFCGALS